MVDEQRLYRKKLTSYGLVYLAGQEMEMSIRNLSLTGALAELADNSKIHNINDVFESVQKTPLVDIYLPEMRLAGEAEVVRADIVDGQIYLALEFRAVSYDVDNVLYKREAYRKPISAPGQIILNDKKYKFLTKNVSVDGLMILLDEIIDVEIGTVTIFDFKRLKLRGTIKISWVDHIDTHSTLIGLQYVQLQKDDKIEIPRFSAKTSYFS